MDQQLSHTLIAAILQSSDIKQGLFPGPGGNSSTAAGGGQKKTFWHWKLAVAVFRGHKIYGPPLERVVRKVEKAASGAAATKLRNSWGDKIKNRLKK